MFQLTVSTDSSVMMIRKQGETNNRAMMACSFKFKMQQLHRLSNPVGGGSAAVARLRKQLVQFRDKRNARNVGDFALKRETQTSELQRKQAVNAPCIGKTKSSHALPT